MSKQFEQTQAILNKGFERAEIVKKNFKTTIEWLGNLKHMMKLLSQHTNNIQKEGDNLHPQVSTINQTMSSLSQATNAMYINLKTEILNEAKKLHEQIGKDISQIKSLVKQHINALSNSYDNFINKMNDTPSKPQSSRECLEGGFNKHRDYLIYFNALNQAESNLISDLEGLKTAISLLISKESDFCNLVNKMCSEYFPNQNPYKASVSSGQEEALFDQFISELKTSIHQQRCPSFTLPILNTFQDQQMKMIVMKNADGRGRGEIPVNQSEIVDLIYSNNSDWWKIRKENGMEGIVPAGILQPAPKQS